MDSLMRLLRIALGVLGVTLSMQGVASAAPSKAPLWQPAIVAPSHGFLTGIAPAPGGNMWVQDAGNADVYQINGSGAVAGASHHSLSQCPANGSGLALNEHGVLWASCYQPSVMTNVMTANSVAVNITQAWGLAFDHVGNIWVSSLEGSVSKFTAQGAATGIAITGLSIGTEHAVAIDATNNVWVVEDGAVVQYGPTGHETGVRIGATYDVGAIAVDAAGNLWSIDTAGQALHGFSDAGASLGASVVSPFASSSRVYFATFDEAGNFWYSTGNAVQEVVGVGRSPGGHAVGHTAPQAPRSVIANMFANTATVTFTPGSDGNLPTHYNVTMYANGHSTGVVCTLTGAHFCSIANLSALRKYQFSVAAVNVLGHAFSDLSNTITYVPPSGKLPSAPGTVTLTPQIHGGGVTLHWRAVTKNKTGRITAYICSGGAQQSVEVPGTSCTLPRSFIVKHGTFVTFTVVSVDAAHRHSAPSVLNFVLS